MSAPLSEPNAWWDFYGREYANRTWRNYRWLLAEFVQQAEGGPLIDLGCGYGFLTECARRFGLPATGLEASATALAEGRRQHPLADLRPWQGGEPLPFADASVGGAVMNEFIDHITLEQNRALFGELARVLRPGGILIVKSPSRFNRFDHDQGHLTFFSPSEFRAFVASFGFEVLQQPWVAQPVFGPSRAGQWLLSQITRRYRPEKWAARIDLVARRPLPSP